MSATHRGDGTSRSASKTRRPSLHPSICRVSSGVKPEMTAFFRARSSSAVLVDGDDHGIAGAGGPGDLVQHGVNVEAGIGPQDGQGEGGDPLP